MLDNLPFLKTNQRIFGTIVAGCVLALIVCICFGAYSAHWVLSLSFIKPHVSATGLLGFWVPFVLALGILILSGWGVILTFMGLTSCLMTASTTGRILRSELTSCPSSDREDYIFYIESEVTYVVEGRQYRNQGRHFFSSYDREKAEGKLAGIKPGDPVTVFYSPRNPDSMNLESRAVDWKGELFGGLCFIGGGLALSVLLGALASRLFAILR